MRSVAMSLALLWWMSGQNVGIGTSNPVSRLHVAGTGASLTVGPFRVPAGEGSIQASGPSADLTFIRRTLTTPPANPAPGDWYALYNPDGTARIWTPGNSDIIYITPDGDIGVGAPNPIARLEISEGPIRFRSLRAGATFLFMGNEQGTPSGDAFRMRFQNYTSVGPFNDFLIFEKTDGNDPDPDGGILFLNTGEDGIEEPSLVIRGTGRTGIGVLNPGAALHIGQVGSTPASLIVGPYATASLAEGRVFITGSEASLWIGRRTLPAWPPAPAPGDAYFWHNPNGTLILRGVGIPADIMSIAPPDGHVGIGTTTPGTYRLNVAGKFRADNLQAFTATVNGCNANSCTYTLSFPMAFNTAPVVTCTAGPNARAGWGALPCMIQSVTTTQVTVMLDCVGCGGGGIQGVKTINIIAMEP